jgi:hypothetical protein
VGVRFLLTSRIGIACFQLVAAWNFHAAGSRSGTVPRALCGSVTNADQSGAGRADGS